MTEADREALRELKATEPFTGFRGQTAHGEPTKAQLLGRGELAFFQCGDRALFVEVLVAHGVIFAYSIRRWDDGRKVEPEEREEVVEGLRRALEALGCSTVHVVRS